MNSINIPHVFNQQNIASYRNLVLNPIKFRIGLLLNLPLAAIAGVKLTKLELDFCEVTVPFKFINKNPFKTTYWAVLGMAAELASGALLMMYTHKSNPSISMFVVACHAKFEKRAVGLTTFKCLQGLEIAAAVEKSLTTLEAEEIKTNILAFDNVGNIIADFCFIWSIKARKPK